MIKIIKYLWLIMVFFMLGCNEKIEMNNIKEVKVYKAKIEVEPSKRKLIYIGSLNPGFQRESNKRQKQIMPGTASPCSIPTTFCKNPDGLLCVNGLNK